VDDAVRAHYRVGPRHGAGHGGPEVQRLAGERGVVASGEEGGGVEAGGEDVEEEQRLEGRKVPGLKQEPPELRVQVPLQGLVPGRQDGDVASAHGGLQRLQQQRLLY
jgi:hypothetical protein